MIEGSHQGADARGDAAAYGGLLHDSTSPRDKITAIRHLAFKVHAFLVACGARQTGPAQLHAARGQAAALLGLAEALAAEGPAPRSLHAAQADAAVVALAPAEHGAPHAAAVLDRARLHQLHEEVGAHGLRDLIRLFLSDAPFLLAELRDAIAQGDAALADRALASLHGAAANLGLAGVAALALDLQQCPLDPMNTELLAEDIARIHLFPALKTAA